MPRKHYKAEEIITLLRQAEIYMSKGQSAELAAKEIGPYRTHALHFIPETSFTLL